MLLFRLATAADAALLAQLGIKTFIETYAEIAPEKHEITKSYAEDSFKIEKLIFELNNRDITYYLALEENRLVGYAKTIISETPDELMIVPALEVEKIYFDKSVQGKGFGKKFFEELKKTAKSNHFKSLWLAVYEDNQNAISFYKKVGFTKFGTRTFEYDWNGTPYSDIDILMLHEL